MKARVQRWGNSLALRIPRSFAADANLRQDSEVDLAIVDGKIVMTPVEAPRWTLEGLLGGVTPENLHAEVDPGAPVGGEAW